ncbi:MAG TPA: glycine cleavage system protein GcvH [Actinomycetospora sp.]|nr:glycine cleavage system protein GcvH [Actinomycetospora sp.]
MVPEGLRYTAEHEWITTTEGDPSVVRVGITDYAQDQLGDVVYVQLPTVGATVSSGESIAEVESTKSVSEIYAPLDGEVTAVNDGLTDTPELINSDPYGSGWMMELRLTDADAVSGLLEASAYQQLIESS